MTAPDPIAVAQQTLAKKQLVRRWYESTLKDRIPAATYTAKLAQLDVEVTQAQSALDALLAP
jgi:hypothetical protein